MPRKVDEINPQSINEEVYHREWQWQEGDLTVTRTSQWTGPGCHDGCSVLFYTKDDKLVDIEGDPNSFYNQGRLCMRCLNMVETVNHPDRLKWPLKRVGERGENKWERVSWDEAYDIICDHVHEIWDEGTPEAIVCLEGTGRNITWQTPYLCYSAFGSPNFALGFLSGDACYLPRMVSGSMCMGDVFVADCSQFLEKRYEDPQWKRPDYMLIWGNNPIKSNGDGFFGHWVVDLMRLGTKLIVVDPELTWLAARAEYWLQLRPGTDTALLLAMIKTIIEEDLYDHDFIDNWSYGFEDLEECVKEYPADKVAEITWVPENLIKEAARAYAGARPGSIQWGLAVDQHISGVSTAMGLCGLAAMCGHLDVPGGCMIPRSVYNINTTYACGSWNLSQEIRAKRISNDVSPLHHTYFASMAQGDCVLQTIETDKPYKVKMVFMQTTNPIANMGAEAPRVYAALKRVPFVVVVDLFMTPTAVAFADVILPAAMSCERNSGRSWWWPLRSIVKVSQFAECKSDEQIILDLGKRLKPENFPWETDIDMMNWWLYNEHMRKGPWPAYTNLTFDELKEQVISWPNDWSYDKFKKGLLRSDGEPGFNTASTLFEFNSIALEMNGFNSLPYYKEPPESPVSTPELYKEYPLILTTGARSYEFFHSEHRQLPTMREFHPDPLVRMNPETGRQYGVQEGDWIWIENRRGKCRQKVVFTPGLDPRVISAEHGWWFPEQRPEEPFLFGVFDSNINNLTTQCVNGETHYGAPYKNLLCKIYKDDGSETVMPSETVTRMGGFGYVKYVK